MDVSTYSSVSSNVAGTYKKTTNADGSVTESLYLVSFDVSDMDELSARPAPSFDLE